MSFIKYGVLNADSGNLVCFPGADVLEHNNIGDAVLVYDEFQRQAAVVGVDIDFRLVRITQDGTVDLTDSLNRSLS